MSEWISVEDRLPGVSFEAKLILKNKNGRIYNGLYMQVRDAVINEKMPPDFYDAHDENLAFPTHWMPKPELPDKLDETEDER